MTSSVKVVQTSAGKLKLWGGELCLDFANTVDWRRRADRKDFLLSVIDLIDWDRQMGAITADEADILTRKAKASPEKAAVCFGTALKLREAIYRIFSSISSSAPPAIVDGDEFNNLLSPLMAGTALVAGKAFTWGWAGDRDSLQRLLWPIAWSAANLLASDRAQRVRECADEGCGWLFIDTSKNARRQWCSMKSCGNRAKARRHYQKIKPGK
jgi:predicted RNA-binding Zn ribbon-like protein